MDIKLYIGRDYGHSVWLPLCLIALILLYIH